MLIDTHAHLLLLGNEYQQFGFAEDEIEEVIERARSLEVRKIISPGTNLETSKQTIEVARRYSKVVYAAVGIHPEEVLRLKAGIAEPVEKIGQLIMENREFIVAVGEVGTDTNNEELTERMSEQQELFRAQCELSLKHDLPIIVHTRASLAETFAVLDKLPKMPRGQFHCFSYDEAGLSEVLARGFYVSFCGNITWSKRLKQLVKMVPKDRLLLETDSPFMMPRDSKGEPIIKSLRNEPQNVRMLASIQAEMRGETIEEVEKITAENTKRLFGI
ncbi:MAG: TatD family hydrolase [bacterium]